MGHIALGELVVLLREWVNFFYWLTDLLLKNNVNFF